MKLANFVLTGLVVALAACSGGSQFPEPTGKGTFRAINAISTSPVINFRLEEVAGQRLQQVRYRGVSASQRFDDFEYNFNFEVAFPGELQTRRVATVTQKIEANRDFTFVITGAVESPTILTWVSDERTFADEDTVAEIRFAHVAESVGTVDVYFAPPGTAPALGQEQGTLSHGDILEARDFETGDYVLTVTAADDPATILYQSVAAEYFPRTTAIVAIFDGTADDTSAIIGRGLVTSGSSPFTLRDARFPSTLELIQASQTLDTVDVYDDEALANLVAASLPYSGTSAGFEIPDGESLFRFTPAGSTGAVLLEASIVASAGQRFELYSVGESDSLLGLAGRRDSQPVEIYPTLAITNTLFNQQVVDVYVVSPGEDITELEPTFASLFGFVSGRLPLEAGVYDVIVTADEAKTPLVSTQIDVANGDVERFTLFATADPNVIELLPQP